MMKKLYLMPQIRIAEIESGCLLADSLTVDETPQPGIRGDARRRLSRESYFDEDLTLDAESGDMFDWGN